MIEFRRSLVPFCSLVLSCSVFILSGCNKSTENVTAGGVAAEIALIPRDMNPNGSITPDGMKKIDEVASKGSFNVYFVRVNLSDSGLAQLGKYPNLHHVEAIGSNLSAGAIEKLKKSAPDSDVSK